MYEYLKSAVAVVNTVDAPNPPVEKVPRLQLPMLISPKISVVDLGMDLGFKLDWGTWRGGGEGRDIGRLANCRSTAGQARSNLHAPEQ